MKLKRIILLLLFSFCISQSFAQKSDFRFGLKATPTLVWLKSDSKEVDSDGSKLTFSWGFMAEYYFADNYAFATGIDLISRGGKYRIGDKQADLRLKFIDLPLTIKMRTNEIGYMRYFGQFGFTPGININSKADTTNNNVTVTDLNIKSSIVPVNVGLYIALGAEYSLGGNTSFLMSVAFNNGFIDLAKEDFKLNSNYVGLNVGVLF